VGFGGGGGANYCAIKFAPLLRVRKCVTLFKRARLSTQSEAG